MATTADAIERLAQVTGLLPATVGRVGRVLREHDANLWPQGAQGRGRQAQVESGHLVNLALGVAVANPITEAAKAVLAYRSLSPLDAAHAAADDVGETTDLLFGEMQPSAVDGYLVPKAAFSEKSTLGADLEYLINRCAQTENAAQILAASSFEVELIIDAEMPAAIVRYRETDLAFTKMREPRQHIYEVPRQYLWSAKTDKRWSFLANEGTAPMVRKTILSAAMFAELAAICRDTLEHRRGAAAATSTRHRKATLGAAGQHAGAAAI